MFKERDVMSKKLLFIILTSIILVFSSVGVDATEVPKTTNDIPIVNPISRPNKCQQIKLTLTMYKHINITLISFLVILT